MDLMDWLNVVLDFLELRHMNTQEHRHRMVLRLVLIPAVIIVSLIAFVICFFGTRVNTNNAYQHTNQLKKHRCSSEQRRFSVFIGSSQGNRPR